MRRPPTRSTTGRRSCSSARSTRRSSSSDATGRRTGSWSSRSSRPGTGSRRRCSGRMPPPPRRTLRALRAAGVGPLASGARAALGDARSVAESLFETERARAWFAGHCAHSMLPLERRPSAGFGLALAVLGHAVGWPFARGGSGRLADALAARVRELGGTLVTGAPVDELPQDRLVLADVSPRELVRLARGRLPGRYERRLLRYRHGPGAFKVDWALDGPIPWRADECRRAGTVHLGGTLDEISRSEWGAWSGRAGRAAVRAARAAVALRRHARAGREAQRLGLLPRAERLGGRHDRADRGAGRALRARLPRARAGAEHDRPGRVRSAQPQPGRRRPERRRDGPRPALPSAAPFARTRRRSTASTSAPPRPRPAAASTACAATGPARPH